MMRMAAVAILWVMLFAWQVGAEQAPSIAKEKVLVYGITNYPPYSYVEADEPKGVYIDILKVAFGKMTDYEISFIMVPWARGLKQLIDGEIPVFFPPYYTKKRAELMIFSEPLLREEVVVFGKKGMLEGKKNWPEDFYGSVFGIVRGFTLEGYGGVEFADAVKNKKIRLTQVNTIEQNLQKLEKGRIDFYLNDKLTDIKPYPSLRRGPITAVNYGHLCFSRDIETFKFIPAFLKRFDRIIMQMRQTKEIEAIVSNYL